MDKRSVRSSPCCNFSAIFDEWWFWPVVWEERSFVRFFELGGVLGQSPCVSESASLLSFSLLLKTYPQTSEHRTALMGECWLELVRPTDLSFLGCLHDAPSLLWIALVELIPRLLGPSASSIKILAALCPEMHNPKVAHLSLQPLHFCHHPSSVFAGLTFNLPVRKRALITEFSIRCRFIELKFVKMPIITK